MVTIIPHAALSPDQPVTVAIGFGATDTSAPDWEAPTQAAVELFVELMAAGGFRESWSGKWQLAKAGSTLDVTFDRLPADKSVLAVLVRMLMALPVPPSQIQVRGTTATNPARSLPSTHASLAEYPEDRAPALFIKVIEPGPKWLNVQVTRNSGLDLALAQRIEEQLDLWCRVARSGGLSEVESDGSITPGDVGRNPAAVGVDFVSSEIMFDFVSFAGVSVLVSLIDELARGGSPIDELSIT